MIQIKQLGGFDIEVIHKAFSDAFSDYVEPLDLTVQQLLYMMERRGCNLDLSFGAFNGNELVGLTLNGIGNWNGKLTAYDTGTGVIKEFRKKGIATRLFSESLPVLRNNNISQYLLEVICTNESAFQLYKKAGFQVTREFDYYLSEKDSIQIEENMELREYYIKEIVSTDWELFESFWDFNPSWQNSIDSIARKIRYFTILGIYKNDTSVGYGIIEKATGDIPQFGVDKKYRRIGLAKKLFKHLIQYSEINTFKIINTDSNYEPFKLFAESINLKPGIGQYEMKLEL